MKAWLVVYLAVVILIVAFMLNARAHGWYEWECCSDSDCAPFAPDDAVTTPQGYRIKGTWTVPYDAPQIRPSHDHDYHLCEYPKGTVRCLYVPAGGV